jgi:O-antigen/teichoic acid export membrane protein
LISESDPPSARPGLARNAFHLGIGQVVTTVLTMVLSAAIARTLGAAEFGMLYLVMSIATFAYVFVDWGHGPYVTREIARRPERSGELMGSVLVVRVVTAVVMCALAVALTWVLGYDVRTRVLAGLLIAAWLPQYLGLTYSWAFRGHERMEYDAYIQVVLKFSTLVLALSCLALGGRLFSLMAAYAAAGTITLVVAVRFYRRLGFAGLRVSTATARELIRDSAPMLAIAMAVAVQPYIDANLLYSLVPASVVGWYGAAWAIAGTLVAPATILGATMYPRLSRASAQPREFSATLRTAFRPLLLVAVLGAVGTYLFADFAIGVVYSKQKFGPAAGILRAFSPALLLIYIDMMFGNAILAAGKAGQLAMVKGASVLVTTALELILINWFQHRFSNGGVGIVFALAGGELVMVAGAVFMLRNLVEVAMAADFARGIAGGAATILLMRALPAVSPLLGIPLCVALYLVLSVAVGLLRRADFDLLASMFRRRAALVPENTPV